MEQQHTPTVENDAQNQSVIRFEPEQEQQLRMDGGEPLRPAKFTMENDKILQTRHVQAGKRDCISSWKPSAKKRCLSSDDEENENTIPFGRFPAALGLNNYQTQRNSASTISLESLNGREGTRNIEDNTRSISEENVCSDSSRLVEGSARNSSSTTRTQRESSPGQRQDEDKQYRKNATNEEHGERSPDANAETRKEANKNSRGNNNPVESSEAESAAPADQAKQMHETSSGSKHSQGSSRRQVDNISSAERRYSEHCRSDGTNKRYCSTNTEFTGSSPVNRAKEEVKRSTGAIDGDDGLDLVRETFLKGKKATSEDDKSTNRAAKTTGEGNLAASSFAWGLWPQPLAPSDAPEGPSLLLLAAAGKKFQTEEKAKAFLETLTEEHKHQLQRRHNRVAKQMLHVPPFEALPREKFRYEAPPVREPGDNGHQSALRSYTKELLEQETQLKALQLHDIVFANLYTRLRDLFPERNDTTLYRMCKVACGVAKRRGLSEVVEPLRRRLEDARFRVARERRKICTGSTV